MISSPLTAAFSKLIFTTPFGWISTPSLLTIITSKAIAESTSLFFSDTVSLTAFKIAFLATFLTTSFESLGKTPSAAVACTVTFPAVALSSNAGYSGNSSFTSVSGSESASASSSLASSVFVSSVLVSGSSTFSTLLFSTTLAL